MPKEYVRIAEGAYRVGETRVFLESLIYLFREAMDAYLAEGQRPAEVQHGHSRKTNAELIAKLQRAQCESIFRLTPKGGDPK